MKVKVLNASSKKTRASIKSAFALVLKEKREIGNITVTELVKKADITRSTFYTHYDNIYDVARDLQDELLDVLFSDVTQISSLDDMKNYLSMLFNYLQNNEKLYKMILSTDEPLLFMDRLNRIMNRQLNEFFKNRPMENKSLNISFFVDGTIHLFIKYFRCEIDTSLEELNNYVFDTFIKFFKY